MLGFHGILTLECYFWYPKITLTQTNIYYKDYTNKRSRRQLRPRCFWLFINRPSLIFDNPYRISTLCIKQHHSFSLVFAWLWVRHSWFIGTFRNNWLHTRLEKSDIFSHQQFAASSASLFKVFALPQFVQIMKTNRYLQNSANENAKYI